jgi:uncharacterized protein with FMN-binding domain
MKKTILSAIFIIVFGFYVYNQKINTAVLAPTDGQNNPSNSSTNEPLNPSSSTPKVTGDTEGEGERPTPPSYPKTKPNTNPAPVVKPPITAPVTTPPASSGQYKDGSYTGASADAYYGNIQVKAIIQGGKITDVQFLDSPHEAPNSLRVNGMARPILTQEAIQAQNANIDGATGATFSSKAFIESLSSALAQAKN